MWSEQKGNSSKAVCQCLQSWTKNFGKPRVGMMQMQSDLYLCGFPSWSASGLPGRQNLWIWTWVQWCSWPCQWHGIQSCQAVHWPRQRCHSWCAQSCTHCACHRFHPKCCKNKEGTLVRGFLLCCDHHVGMVFKSDNYIIYHFFCFCFLFVLPFHNRWVSVCLFFFQIN